MREAEVASRCGAIGEIIAPANTIATTTRTREALSSNAQNARERERETNLLLSTG